MTPATESHGETTKIEIHESAANQLQRGKQNHAHAEQDQSAVLVSGEPVCQSFATLQLVRRAFVNFNFRRFTVRLSRWRHWEFWPAWMFYPPVAIYCAWLALKYRGLTVPTAANPGIFSGGIVGESKMATLKELFLTSPKFTAEAELIVGDALVARLRSLDEIRTRLGIDFPFILKPDVGQRGAGIS